MVISDELKQAFLSGLAALRNGGMAAFIGGEEATVEEVTRNQASVSVAFS